MVVCSVLAGVPEECQAGVCEAAHNAAGLCTNRDRRPSDMHQPRARRLAFLLEGRLGFVLTLRPCTACTTSARCAWTLGPALQGRPMQIHQIAVLWQVGRSARTTVVATQGSPTLRDNIVTVFGSRVADGLEQLRVDGPSGASISGHA